MIQAALNGARRCDEHPGIPCSAEELARDAVACVAAGAVELHLHPRDANGQETLDPLIVYSTIRQVKAAVDVPVGISTGAWIEPDLERRLASIRAWYGPDYASVNCSETGAVEVMYALIGAGIGIEVGIARVEDVDVFARSLLLFSAAVVRILVEPASDALQNEDAARECFDAMHQRLDAIGCANARLQHTDGPLVWFGVRDARRRGLDTRIGFEDTLTGPRRKAVSSNAELVAAAARIPERRR